MEAHKQLTIGLFGFGVVGEGLYRVLGQTPSFKATIKKICIKNPHKKRNAPQELFTTKRNDLLNDESINVIVEVIDDADAAFEILTTALKNGKSVVSASKRMIAENLQDILEQLKHTEESFLYEAAACASIPVIRNLEEYYDNDLLHSIKAIVNGSTNFILTKMFEDKLNFQQALSLAQQLGFAESNPRLDVEGYDAVNKWTFLLTHAYGIVGHPSDIVFNGIRHIHAGDAEVAVEKHYQIKLVAQAKKLNNGKIAAFVLPQFIVNDDPLSFVKNEYNGVVIESGFADKQFFYGKGAGSLPTGSAVLSDLSALRYQYRYEYKKLYHHPPHELTDDFSLRVYLSFDSWKLIPREKFEWIEEWHAGADRNYLIGVIAFKELRNAHWWKENNTSLILAPDAVIEETDYKKLRKKYPEHVG